MTTTTHTYTDEVALQFVREVEPGWDVEHYYGRGSWEGPMIRLNGTDDLVLAIRATTVPVTWDTLGEGYAFRPIRFAEGTPKPPCRCGHEVGDHQSGDGAFTGFCGGTLGTTADWGGPGLSEAEGADPAEQCQCEGYVDPEEEPTAESLMARDLAAIAEEPGQFTRPDEPFIRLQRLVEDGETSGWVVDLDNWETVIGDTSSRWFRREDDAREFADELAALLISLRVVRVEDDVA